MKKIIYASLLLALSTGPVFARGGYEVTASHPQTQAPSFIRFTDPAQAPDPAHPELWFRSEFQLGDGFGLQLLREQKDAAGNLHRRYQQLYRGIPVDGAVLNLHFRAAQIASMSGVFYPGLTGAAAISLNESQALDKAMAAFPAALFAWQSPAYEAMKKRTAKNPAASWYPEARLVVVQTAAKDQALSFSYAYRFDINILKPFAHKLVYVDAANGNILRMDEMIHDVEKPGVGHTKYSGKQNIVADSTADGHFVLEEMTRGNNGIGTFNAKHLLSSGTGSPESFEDDDNDWNNVNADQDEIATDIHWAMEKTHDYYRDVLGRNSLDDAGKELVGLAHMDLTAMGMSLSNAFWSGGYAFFGDGDGVMCSPMTSIDIVAHELTHGLTEYSAGLEYRDEPGALNESFSDILGKAIERYATPAAATWEMGKQVMLGSVPSLRHMKDPNTRNHPKFYKGKFYYTGSADAGGVHTNSSIQNLWFALLCDGGSGFREPDAASYNVAAIGWDKAVKIAYTTLTAYLSSTSQYKDAANSSMDVAASLYGAGSKEAYEVQMAWYAVGLAEKPVRVSVPESVHVDFRVYPNPSRDEVWIQPEVPFSNATISLFSMTGQLLEQRQASGAAVQMALSDYPAGMYLVEIREAGRVGRVKLSHL